MELNIKCPQCGATQLENIEGNKYKCAYCGFVFSDTAINNTKFVEKETDEFKIKQKIELEEYSEQIKKKKHIYSIWCFIAAIGALIFGVFLGAFQEYHSDKEVKFPSQYYKYAFLESAPFYTKDGKEIRFKDFARIIIIDRKEYKTTDYLFTGIEFNGKRMSIKRDADSLKIYLYSIDDEEIYAERQVKGTALKPFFTFKNEEDVRNYLTNKKFESLGDTISFAKGGYEMTINNETIFNSIIIKVFTDSHNEERASFGDSYMSPQFVIRMGEYGENPHLVEYRTKRNFKYIK